jgi:hypothetical protein
MASRSRTADRPVFSGRRCGWRHFELEGDLLADEHTTGFEGGVPVDAPIPAVDGGRAVEADALVAVGVDGAAGVREVDGLLAALDELDAPHGAGG